MTTPTFVVEVCHTQRYFPLVGWGKRRLPTDRWEWADRSGKQQRTKDIIEGMLPRECEWTGPWELQTHPATTTDKDGWEYALDMIQEYHPKATPLDFVRRRVWTRAGKVREAYANQLVASCPSFENNIVDYEKKTADMSKRFGSACQDCYTEFSLLNAPRNCDNCRKHFCAKCCTITVGATTYLCAPCEKERCLRQLKELAQSAELTSQLETTMRSEVLVEEQRAWGELELMKVESWKRVMEQVATRLNVRHNRSSSVLAADKKKIVDKWQSIKGPRHAEIVITITGAFQIPPANPQRRLRVTIRSDATQEHASSPMVFTAIHPDFASFSSRFVVQDDSKRFVITMDEFNPKFLDVSIAGVSDKPNPLFQTALNVREALNKQTLLVDVSDNLMYIERGAVWLPLLTPKAFAALPPLQSPPASAVPSEEQAKASTAAPGITVRWETETREVESMVDFCDECGRIKSRCECKA